MENKVLTKDEVRLLEPTLPSDENSVNNSTLIDETNICIDWLRKQTITKTINKKLTSYSMKHHIEEWYENKTSTHKYISSNSVIDAIITSGIPYLIVGSEVMAAIRIKKEKKKGVYYNGF